MKILKYNLCNLVNKETEEEPKIEEVFTHVEMGWNEVNEEIAKRESYNGEYTIEDDGLEESSEPTQEERIAELEDALNMLLSGVTE